MAGISGAAPRQDPKSSAESPKTTPCDLPRFLSSTLHDPNWIFRARRILPPTRSIVVGASRVLASVIGFESSSSSSSSSDCGPSSDGTHDHNDYQDVSSQEVNATEDREPKLFAGKDETMCLIQQLLTQESFSRKECGKLTNIIKSRVVDSPSIGGRLDIGRLDEIPERTDVLEATRSLEEKSGANSKSGSPLGMAKSCMQTRPPWASYSKKNIEFRSPSSTAMPLLIGDNFLYSSKRKRGSLATGSWNIHDEIRKVRSKATEEAPRTPSSSKNDRSSFPLEPKTGPDPILASNLGPATKRPEDEVARIGNADGFPSPKVKRELLLYETSNETDAAAASGLQQQRNTPTSKDSLAGKSNSGLETQQQQQKGKKLTRYNTRNRARRR